MHMESSASTMESRHSRPIRQSKRNSTTMAAIGVTAVAARSGSLWASRSSVSPALSSMSLRSRPDWFPVKKPRGSFSTWVMAARRMFRAVRKAAIWVDMRAAKYSRMLPTAVHTAIQPQSPRFPAPSRPGQVDNTLLATSQTHRYGASPSTADRADRIQPRIVRFLCPPA